MAKAKKTAKTEKPAAESVEKKVEIPVFVDADGYLRKLRGADFPKSKAGKMAFCDYNVKKWEMKKVKVESGMDPLAKKKKRREKLLAKLEELDKELLGEEAPEEAETAVK